MINSVDASFKLTPVSFDAVSMKPIRAAKTFFENGRSLEIIDIANRLKYLQPSSDMGVPPPPPPPGTRQNGSGNGDGVPPPGKLKMFELPIDLTEEKVAYLSYPKGKMTLEDIDMLEIMITATISALKASVGKKREVESG